MIENGQDKQSGDSQKKQRKCQKRPGECMWMENTVRRLQEVPERNIPAVQGNTGQTAEEDYKSFFG